MEWKNICHSSSLQSISEEKFWHSVMVWIEKPHVVNKRLCGAEIVAKTKINNSVLLCDPNLNILLKRLVEENLDNLEDALKDLQTDCTTEVHAIIRDVLPKLDGRFQTVREVVLLDKKKHVACFIPVSNLRDTNGDVCLQSYRISWIGSSIEKRIEIDVDCCESNLPHVLHNENWLRDTLLPKLVKWTCDGPIKHSIPSLGLVKLERYNALYQEMKVKYGYDLVKNWSESTDPQKFVYEELAIASYLMVMFEEEYIKTGKKQTFVDLGCGNGMLVYILASEGYCGIGVDLRKRKIWKKYGSGIELKEMTITPSDKHLFPGYDWIIGNHSDELTPWIPVIAARSSFSCKFFVLPCCSHDFNCKFKDRKANLSLYQAYLEYIQDIGVRCGFETEKDSLRIPSTKRICFVGRTRSYTSDRMVEIEEKIHNFIIERCKTNSKTQKKNSTDISIHEEKWECNQAHKKVKSLHENQDCEGPSIRKYDRDESDLLNNDWIKNFTPRSNVEKTRNCSDVDRNLCNFIVDTVFKAILKHENGTVENLGNGRLWNRGGAIDIADVASMFDGNCLKQLKAECGGIQTLLRNQQIFKVYGGKVRLLENNGESKRLKTKNKQGKDLALFFKTKLCWFHDHHPDGCPLEAIECQFAHGKDELRTAMKKRDKT